MLRRDDRGPSKKELAESALTAVRSALDAVADALKLAAESEADVLHHVGDGVEPTVRVPTMDWRDRR
jgi:hypothetical protein